MPSRLTSSAVRDMHANLSPTNAYFRFFNFSPRAPQREAERVSRPADDEHVALLALLHGELVGVATYEPAGTPGRAEIAFAVSDDMHGRGVATLLLEHLVSVARQRNLVAFQAETLPDNYAMQRRLRRRRAPGRAPFRRRSRRADVPAAGARR